MKKPLTNFAFIDGQNLHRGMAAIGWALDYERFRRYLAEKHGVGTAYMFIGYLPEYQGLYQSLQKAGYVLVFKEVLRRVDKQVKGNVDAELVLQAMIDYPNYAEAVIVTSDGDFACLVRYLREQRKLRAVVSPLRDHCSVLLRKAARHHIQFLDRLRSRLEYQKK
jgi:uncharacterized LabA/DUF88 family protein